MAVNEMGANIAFEPGPMAILCREIDFISDRSMEMPGLLVAFVSVLVRHVADMRRMSAQIAKVASIEAPSEDSAEVLRRVEAMLAIADTPSMIAEAAAVHNLIHEVSPDDAYPCDHLIDLLSSCVSAVRFGLEVPCRSRHAAAAAAHVWERLYGIKLFDRLTPRWSKDWARFQLQEAITIHAVQSALRNSQDPPK